MEDVMNAQLAIKYDFSLKNVNTFGIDERAAMYLPVSTLETLQRVYDDPGLRAMKRLILGGGSNVLFTGPFDGLVLHMMNKGIQIASEDAQSIYIRAAAGEKWQDVVEWTLSHGIGGLENLSWIPGTVGAAPVQNIGAYGTEVSEFLDHLIAYDFETGQMTTMNRDACQLSYRSSIFKHEMKDRRVVWEVVFKFPKVWKANVAYGDIAKRLQLHGITQPTPRQISDVIIAVRQAKLPDPKQIGNAGSFFKNPTVTAEQLATLKERFPEMPAYAQADGTYRIAAGWLIDQCGWKNFRQGQVGVCRTQALVLVNYGGGTGSEIVSLADAIRSDVRDTFHVSLEPETVFI